MHNRGSHTWQRVLWYATHPVDCTAVGFVSRCSKSIAKMERDQCQLSWRSMASSRGAERAWPRAVAVPPTEQSSMQPKLMYAPATSAMKKILAAGQSALAPPAAAICACHGSSWRQTASRGRCKAGRRASDAKVPGISYVRV